MRFSQYKTRISIGLSLALITWTCGHLPAHATSHETTLSFSGPDKAALGTTVTIRALLTSPTPVNVVQSAVVYDANMLEVISVSSGSSILRYWQQQPSLDRINHRTSFTGGLPTPGFQGTDGELITLSVKTKSLGVTTVSFAPQSQVLANDGAGSPVPWAARSLILKIEEAKKNSSPLPTIPIHITDTDPPTNLELIVGHDSHLFDGDWFAAFQAIDTNSGIDYYEIAETTPDTQFPKEEDWGKASSPFRLHTQDKDSKIFLRAVDKAGNQAVISRTHKIKTPTTTNIPERPWSLILLLLLAIICLIVILRKRRATKPNKSVQKQKLLL